MRSFILLSTVLCLFSACSKNYDFNSMLKMEKAFREESTEIETAKDSAKFAEKAQELIEAYQIYAKNNPKNMETGEFLYKAAGLSESFTKNDAAAVKMYEEVFTRFPSDQSGMMALFRSASIYQNKLKDKEKAIATYTKFVEQYPQSFQAVQAKVALDELSEK